MEDAKALFDELRYRGARVVAEPELQPYGVLELAVEDLDDNRIRFDQRLASDGKA